MCQFLGNKASSLKLRVPNEGPSDLLFRRHFVHFWRHFVHILARFFVHRHFVQGILASSTSFGTPYKDPFCTQINVEIRRINNPHFVQRLHLGVWANHFVHIQIIPNRHGEPHFVQEPYFFQHPVGVQNGTPSFVDFVTATFQQGSPTITCVPNKFIFIAFTCLWPSDSTWTVHDCTKSYFRWLTWWPWSLQNVQGVCTESGHLLELKWYWCHVIMYRNHPKSCSCELFLCLGLVTTILYSTNVKNTLCTIIL